MANSNNYYSELEADGFYHIYGRSNNRELLFRTPDNYEYFLHLYSKYIDPICRTFSWCLLPNHFHYLIQIHPIDRIFEYLSGPKNKSGFSFDALRPTVHKLVSNVFRSLFITYAMAFNRSFIRSGNLFNRPFKRLRLYNERQLIETAIYMHTNPRYHGLTAEYERYPWSSYGFILQQEHLPEPAYCLSLLGGSNGFIASHKQQPDRLPATAIEEKLPYLNAALPFGAPRSCVRLF